MKPEEILEIADENGFDNFGYIKGYLRKFDGYSQIIYSWPNGSENGKLYPEHISLADLATNKSFLEALAIEMLKRNENFKVGNKYVLNKKDSTKALQQALIKRLTNNNGKEFWEICSDFIGEINENH